jgi:1-acyl-sn-glycerol-3-phosphate acyltransferase
MKLLARSPQPGRVPRVSPWLVRAFAKYARGYLLGRFHSLRILRSSLPPSAAARPLVIYLNHAAWWDPLVCLRLAQHWFAERTSFGPIDAAMLGKYGFFQHLGFYGVEQHSARGARQFLRTTRAILASSQNVVWLTPQGRFTDVRERPLRLQPGLAALPAHAGEAMFVPLAIEYAYWTEPRPEILVGFGEPILPRDEPPHSAGEWQRRFTDALEDTQDELAARSCRRDPAEWLTLDRGGSGVSAIYDTWRRLRARLRGETFSPEHHPETAP